MSKVLRSAVRQITLVTVNPKSCSIHISATGAFKQYRCSTRAFLDEWGVDDLSEVIGMSAKCNEVLSDAGWQTWVIVGPA